MSVKAFELVPALERLKFGSDKSLLQVVEFKIMINQTWSWWWWTWWSSSMSWWWWWLMMMIIMTWWCSCQSWWWCQSQQPHSRPSKLSIMPKGCIVMIGWSNYSLCCHDWHHMEIGMDWMIISGTDIDNIQAYKVQWPQSSYQRLDIIQYHTWQMDLDVISSGLIRNPKLHQ